MKKEKDNTKWLFLGIGIIIGVVFSLMLQPQPEDGFDATNTEWGKALSSSETKIIYMGRPTCHWCSKFKPGLDNLSEQYNINYVYVNIDEIGETELNKVFDALDIISDEFGTPYMAIVKDGKKIDEQPGYINEEALFKFLQKNGFINKDAKYTPNEKTPTEE